MSIDPVFPLPEPTFLWVHTLQYRVNSPDDVAVDEEGRWNYTSDDLPTFVGYLTAPDPREVARADSTGVILDAVCLAPYSTGIGDDDFLIAAPGSGVQPILEGTYKVGVVRPNPSHLRILLSRIRDELPRHDAALIQDAMAAPDTVTGNL